MIDSAFVINPGLFAGKLPYDTKKDFAPVSLLAMSPLVLVVHPSVPANSAQEFVALAKRKPGEVTFASAGLGTAIHLAGEQFRQVARIDINHIPYRGGGPSVIDLLAGKVDFTFSTIPAILEHVRGGNVRALGITGAARHTHLPDVPTMAEAGLAGVNSAPLFGMVAPAATPPAVIARLRRPRRGAVKSSALNAAADRDRLCAGRQHAGRIPRAHRRRDRQMDADHPGSEYQADLNFHPQRGLLASAITITAASNKGSETMVERHETGPRMSQVVIHGNTVYLAGVVARNNAGKSMTEQTKEILSTIDGYLAKAGTDKSKLLSANIWITDMANFNEMNAVWDGWVSPGNTPARATVEAKLAAPGYKVEIMVVAAK